MADDEINDEELDDAAAVEGPAAEDLDGDVDEAAVPAAAADDADGDDDKEDDKEDDDAPRTARKKPDEEEDDEEDLVDDDDVEADLDKILKDRMVTADDADADEPDDRSEGGERLQPKQQNEQLCPSCFLLVKSSAPNCPVGDDDCPIFS